MTDKITAYDDMRARWLPSDAARELAKAALKAVPGDDILAVVPMVQPGKTRGQWVTGQEVYTVPGVVLIGANTYNDDMVPEGVAGLSWATMRAEEIAAAELHGRPGTTAYAIIDRDGEASVFEGMLPR